MPTKKKSSSGSTSSSGNKTNTKKRTLKQTRLSDALTNVKKQKIGECNKASQPVVSQDMTSSQEQEDSNVSPLKRFNSVFWVNSEGAQVEYVENFMSPSEADDLFNKLLQPEYVYERHIMKIWGKNILSPRTGILIGTKEGTPIHADYYSRKTYDWFPEIYNLKQKIERYLKDKYNEDYSFSFALINRYDSGDDYIGWHADREARDTPIVSMSLGEERTFKLRRIDTKQVVASNDLKHGSMVVMKGTVQQLYKHCVPKTARKKGTRLNITFRYE